MASPPLPKDLHWLATWTTPSHSSPQAQQPEPPRPPRLREARTPERGRRARTQSDTRNPPRPPSQQPPTGSTGESGEVAILASQAAPPPTLPVPPSPTRHDGVGPGRHPAETSPTLPPGGSKPTTTSLSNPGSSDGARLPRSVSPDRTIPHHLPTWLTEKTPSRSGSPGPPPIPAPRKWPPAVDRPGWSPATAQLLPPGQLLSGPNASQVHVGPAYHSRDTVGYEHPDSMGGGTRGGTAVPMKHGRDLFHRAGRQEPPPPRADLDSQASHARVSSTTRAGPARIVHSAQQSTARPCLEALR